MGMSIVTTTIVIINNNNNSSSNKQCVLVETTTRTCRSKTVNIVKKIRNVITVSGMANIDGVTAAVEWWKSKA